MTQQEMLIQENNKRYDKLRFLLIDFLYKEKLDEDSAKEIKATLIQLRNYFKPDMFKKFPNTFGSETEIFKIEYNDGHSVGIKFSDTFTILANFYPLVQQEYYDSTKERKNLILLFLRSSSNEQRTYANSILNIGNSIELVRNYLPKNIERKYPEETSHICKQFIADLISIIHKEKE